MDDREQLLGFKPQKEIIYNKLLPYNDAIDAETNAVLSEIKANLGRAVQLRDLKVGAGHWVGQLSRYIRLYGLKFSKEDHVNFIHLLYELTVIPDLEMSLVSKFAQQLSGLLKKKKLLSRDDLTLQWKPLYKLLESVLYSQYEQHGLQLFPGNIESVLKNLVRDCRTYFPAESTQEMLDEWRPLLCPFDVTVIKALQYLDLFLPTNLMEHEMDKGFRLWFKELMDMWDSFQNNPSWEKCLINLMSRLANSNIGYIDWSPYIPKVFTRLLKGIELPVGTQPIRIVRSKLITNRTETTSFVIWIVNMMGGEGNKVQDHIDMLFKTLQNFYHPSNLGKWNIKLSGLLMTFPKVFIRRINRERYRKPTWMKEIPASHKLSDAEITKFVESMKSTVFTCMFSKYGSQDSAVALRHLSTLRPELIVPTLLEFMYPAMETLIEPHRLIACMNCVVSVVRAMLSAGKWYPEGRSHLIPLLNLSLPGIDPNDFKKCLVTFQMISTFVSLVPIVDCSDAVHSRTDLTEEERELCSATAQFEDFVLQFVDRIFALIENSAQEHVHGNQDKLNPEQMIVEKALASTFTSVLQQSSTPIFMSALRRLHNFITGSVYESRVGGRYAGNLIRAAQQVNPKETLKMFMDNICDSLLVQLKSHEEVLQAERLDDGFLWNLLMFSQLLRCNGSYLLPYKTKIVDVFTYILRLQCVQGYEIAGKSLMYLLRGLTLVFPVNYASVSGSLDRPVTEYLAIREWAKPGDIDNLGLEWHEPCQEETDFVQELLEKFLVPELNTLKQISAENAIPREDLLRRLNIIMECLNGAGGVLPMWQGNHISMIESQVPLKRFGCAKSCGSNREVTVSGGQNVRVVVIEAIRKLLRYMLSCAEDDTKSFHRLLRIYESVLFFHGIPEGEFDARWKSFHAVKKALEDKLRGGKNHLRAILVDRVLLQHQMRCLQKTDRSFTARHQELLQDLYTLSISRYSEVRKKAQSVLFQHFHNYPYSYRTLVDPLVSKVLSPDTPEHEFQGALYVVLGNNKRNIATKRSWEIISKVWPAITQAQHSEKPSILNLIDQIVSKTVKNAETTEIKILVNERSLAAAGKLFESQHPLPSQGTCSSIELQAAIQHESSTNDKCQKMYVDLVTKLTGLVTGGNLRWKFCQIGMEFMTLLIRHDAPLPTCAVELFVQKCVDDSIYLRKISTSALLGIQKQHKRPHKKIKFDPTKQGVDTGVTAPGHTLSPGDRPDNRWHKYNSQNLPDTQDKWEKLVVIEKTHWGYYTWPKEMETYAPHSEQPKLNRSTDELTEGEKVVYNAFSNKDYVQKLVDFLALEENKNKDKFSQKKMTLFKGLFRNYGDCLLENFKAHIERLVSDTSHDKHDSSQRCAMEILAGILRGSKHWPYQQTKALWDWAIPLMRTAVNNLTVSTVSDWSTFFTNVSESRDPRKIYWLYEMLMDNPLNGEGGSFGDAGRLLMIQNALLQQEWRVGDLHRRLYTYLSPHFSYTYKNVRDRLGSLLSDVFILDYKMFPWSMTTSPARKEFIDHVLPQLHKLKDLIIEEAQNQNGGSVEASTTTDKQLETSVEKMDIDNQSEESEERKELIRLCKTVMKCLTSCISRTFNSAPPEVIKLLPVMCTLESESKDEELNTDCTVALASLSQALIQPEVIPDILHTVKTVTGLQSWHARSAILGYIQVMVFCNFFTLQDPKHKENIKETVMHLICDDKLEVREMASITLSGLLQCGYLEMDQDLLDHFERLSSTKISKRIKSENLPVEKLLQRHAGVLGLSAYVQAYPYDVPEFMPQILMDLSNHVNDPQPIQMTVKKTLSNFRRTHHDNWHDHKLMFTDDQLVILTDLLVSPNYYA
ncbi:proteasome activator complex subunit 4B-like [Ruditapes philippinarum]|uniref:proteasome activator complex subunit 4B-like n=1 Tax=Ruditapes philippinarum TaxID=129788 RepID=UPI00295BECB8|nr:proteasome activator complex subunit 4B-like [Ruditapes philippinarum]